MIGIGLIGIGGFASAHLSAVQDCQESGAAKLVAVVIRNPVKYREQKQRLRSQGVRIYRTPEEMFNDEKGKIKLIGNPTAIAHHSDLSIKALQGGYHVLCEKPVAGTLPEGLNMWEVQRKAGKILSIFFQHLYSPTIQRIKEIALEKRLGRLIQCRTRVLWPRGLDYYERNSWAGKLTVEGRSISDSPAQNAAAGIRLWSKKYATKLEIKGSTYRSPEFYSSSGRGTDWTAVCSSLCDRFWMYWKSL